MKIIFGLGNPGPKYRNNRHNAGYKVVEAISRESNRSFKKKIILKAWLSDSGIKGDRRDFLLVKPNTFMNNSGRCVRRICSKYKLTSEDILVVYDDVDLDLGVIRLRKEGSAGGHRGMSSIIEALGTERISRLRVGIGRDPGVDTSDYVLSDFLLSEQGVLIKVIDEAVLVCLDWAKH